MVSGNPQPPRLRVVLVSYWRSKRAGDPGVCPEERQVLPPLPDVAALQSVPVLLLGH